MKSKNIEKEVDELNNRFNQLEIKYNRLSDKYAKDNTKLKEHIHQLEDKNFQQEKTITDLKQNHKRYCTTTNTNPSLSRESFQEGDLVKVTNLGRENQ